MYNMTALTNTTSFPGILGVFNTSTGSIFVMGLLILINIILFMTIYRTSGLKSAVVGSVFPMVFLSALLYPMQYITQSFFVTYMFMGLAALFVLFHNR